MARLIDKKEKDKTKEQYITHANKVEKKYGIPNNLLVGLIKAESALDPEIIAGRRKSSAGAIGIAQFMPGTAKEFGIDPTEPFQSIDAAGKYLAQNYKKLNNWDDTLRSYNAGLGTVNLWKAGKKKLPKETRDYVGRVYQNANINYSPSNKPVVETYKNSVAPYMNQPQYNSIITPIVTNFDNINQGITFTGNEVTTQKEVDPRVQQATVILQQKQNEEDFINDLFSQQEQVNEELYINEQVQQQNPLKSISQTFSEISNFVDGGNEMAQQGGQKDKWGSDITARERLVDTPRTFYESRTNTMLLGSDYQNATQEEKDNIKTHENRHAWQYKNDRSNFNITHNSEYDFQDRLQKKPTTVSTDEIYDNYHNRQQKETDLEIQRLKQNNSQFSFVPDQIIYNKGMVDNLYDNKFSLEGEAQFYQDTGERSFQQGGGIIKAQQELTPKSFLIDYIKSSKYKERLNNSGYIDVKKEISHRLDNLNRTKIYEEKPSFWESIKNFELPRQEGSNYADRIVSLDNTTDKKRTQEVYKNMPSFTKKEVEAHELGHAITVNDEKSFMLNNYDIRNLKGRGMNLPYVNSHDKMPSENKADLDAFRYNLKIQGIYDARKENFTKEHLKKANKSFSKERLLRNYSDKNLIWLMNNVAENNKVSDNRYAQQGGITEKEKVFLESFKNMPIKDERLEVKSSKIQGEGIFAKEKIEKGTNIGLAHTNSQPSTELGRMHNHSDTPNSESILIDNKRFIFTKYKIKKGEEITVDYKKQPELEQPQNFK